MRAFWGVREMRAQAQGAQVDITLRDTKLKKLTAELERFTRMEIQIGYYADGNHETYEDGTSVVDVATFHEFGTQNMPQRSFLRGALKENRAVMKSHSKKVVAELVKGKINAKTAARRIAHAMAKIVWRKLVTASSWAEPLAHATIERKGHARILVDTELLRNELSWRVLEKGSVLAEGKAKNVRITI